MTGKIYTNSSEIKYTLKPKIIDFTTGMLFKTLSEYTEHSTAHAHELTTPPSLYHWIFAGLMLVSIVNLCQHKMTFFKWLQIPPHCQIPASSSFLCTFLLALLPPGGWVSPKMLPVGMCWWNDWAIIFLVQLNTDYYSVWDVGLLMLPQCQKRHISH